MNSFIASLAVSLSAIGNPRGPVANFVPDRIDYIEAAATDLTASRSSSYHPSIKGFDYVGGTEEKIFKDREVDGKSIGYLCFDVNLYKAAFTENSMLVLAHAETTAVSGYIANQAGKSNYDQKYDLTKLIVHLSVPRVRDKSNDYFTPDVSLADWWPKSGEDSPVGSYEYKSEFGIGTEFGADFGASVGTGGVEISAGVGASVNLTYSVGSTITTADPAFSSAPVNEHEEPYNSSFYIVDYKKYGRIAYTLNSYALFEIAYDAYGFNDMSFVFDYYVDMEVGKNLFAWQDHYEHIDYGFRCYYNLGYLPDAGNVVLFE